jgi:hypothetical protein
VTVCFDCHVKGVVLFGHAGRCANCYRKYQLHQKELREEGIRNRELLAARVVHPSGRSPRWRQRDWLQKKDPETGRSTA